MLRWLALAAGLGLAAHGWLSVAALPFHAGRLLCAAGAAGLSAIRARRGARFYEPVFPDLRAGILANRLHTLLVTQIAKKYGVHFIDISPGLNAANEDAYVDVIHFTQIGRERLAANIFAGLRPPLTAASAGCRPKTPEGAESRADAATSREVRPHPR